MTPDPRSEEQLRKDAYLAVINFAQWNSGKNIPNILIQLLERIEQGSQVLGQKIEDSGKSAGRLATSLNWITGVVALFTAVQAVAVLYPLVCHK